MERPELSQAACRAAARPTGAKPDPGHMAGNWEAPSVDIFKVCFQNDRNVYFSPIAALLTWLVCPDTGFAGGVSSAVHGMGRGWVPGEAVLGAPTPAKISAAAV